MRKLIPVFVIGCIGLGLLFAHPNPVNASTDIMPGDLIALVNGWRVNTYGFSPLIVDSTLMGTAQYTAQFMADNPGFFNASFGAGFAGAPDHSNLFQGRIHPARNSKGVFNRLEGADPDQMGRMLADSRTCNPDTG